MIRNAHAWSAASKWFDTAIWATSSGVHDTPAKPSTPTTTSAAVNHRNRGRRRCRRDPSTGSVTVALFGSTSTGALLGRTAMCQYGYDSGQVRHGTDTGHKADTRHEARRIDDPVCQDVAMAELLQNTATAHPDRAAII